MNILSQSLLVILCSAAVHSANLRFKPNSVVGFFWQISDIHYDEDYSTAGVPSEMCHKTKENKSSATHPGVYGDYLCDAPWKLVTSAIEAMKSIESTPDFIIWTGDSIPHVKDSQLNQTEVFKIIGNVTTKLAETFPNISIYPVLGNHDPYPSNQMSPKSGDSYYTGILNASQWRTLLNTSHQEEFKIGGYYSSIIRPGLRLLALNTNLYYQMDKLVVDKQDPAGQFAWMEKQLIDARSKKDKVYIISHVPPGAFERLAPMTWFYPQFNQLYLDIIEEYSDVIVGQFYGHEHTDSFRILLNSRDAVYGSMFLSPAVTPWKSTLPGVGANNPSIRLYWYLRETGDVLDYKQYYLNLPVANSGGTPDWRLEYQATSYFDVADLSAGELDRLSRSYHEDDSAFHKYLLINSVGYDPNPKCNSTCKRNQICAIRQLNFDRYTDCLRGAGITTPGPHPTTHHHHHHKPVPVYMFYVIGGMGGVILVLTILFAIVCFNRGRRQRVPFKYGRFAGPIN